MIPYFFLSMSSQNSVKMMKEIMKNLVAKRDLKCPRCRKNGNHGGKMPAAKMVWQLGMGPAKETTLALNRVLLKHPFYH